MQLAQEVVNQARFLRTQNNIKLRQPLAKLSVIAPGEKPHSNLLQVIADEVNVKEISWKTGSELKVKLELKLTPELEAEGEARELMREIQKLRKQAQLTLDQKIKVAAPAWPKDWQAEIERKTNTKLVKGQTLSIISS